MDLYWSPFIVIGNESDDSSRGNCSEFKDMNLLHLRDYAGYYVATVIVATLNILICTYGFHVCSLQRVRRPALVFLLTGLTVCELLFNLGIVILKSLLLALRYNVLASSWRLPMVTVSWTITLAMAIVTGFHLMRNWTVVFIAMFRYIAISRPLKTYRFFVKSILRPSYLVAMVCVFMLGIPRVFEYQLFYCTEFQLLVWLDGYLAKQATYKWIYFTVLLFLFQSGGPVLLVGLINGLTSRAICLYNRRRSFQTLLMRRQQHSADKTVILLSIIFFVCEMPAFVNKLMPCFNIPRRADLMYAFLANLFTCIDSSLNFFVYLVASGNCGIFDLSRLWFSSSFFVVFCWYFLEKTSWRDWLYKTKS